MKAIDKIARLTTVHEHLVIIANALNYDLRDMYKVGKSDVYMRIPDVDNDIILKAYLNDNKVGICIKSKKEIIDKRLLETAVKAGFKLEKSTKFYRCMVYYDFDLENYPTADLVKWINYYLKIAKNIVENY